MFKNAIWSLWPQSAALRAVIVQDYYRYKNVLNFLLDKITSYPRHYPSSFPIMAG